MRELATGCSASTTFVIADLHFGDERTCRSRPFRDAAEMGSETVLRWNETVSPHDVVYVLGDIGGQSHFGTIRQLHGTKHLIVGNADNLRAVASAKLFASLSIARWLRRFLLTHIPVHPSQLGSRAINVHGHLHGNSLNDVRYRCVSADQTDFTPVRLADLSTGLD